MPPTHAQHHLLVGERSTRRLHPFPSCTHGLTAPFLRRKRSLWVRDRPPTGSVSGEGQEEAERRVVQLRPRAQAPPPHRHPRRRGRNPSCCFPARKPLPVGHPYTRKFFPIRPHENCEKRHSYAAPGNRFGGLVDTLTHTHARARTRAPSQRLKLTPLSCPMCLCGVRSPQKKKHTRALAREFWWQKSEARAREFCALTLTTIPHDRTSAKMPPPTLTPRQRI